MFSTRLDNFFPFLSNLKLSSANSFSLEESKICCLVMDLPFPKQTLVFTYMQYKSFKNTVGKGEIGRVVNLSFGKGLKRLPSEGCYKFRLFGKELNPYQPDFSRVSLWTHPCLTGVSFLTSTWHISSKPSAAFPQNGHRNDGQKLGKNDSYLKDYLQSSERNLAEWGKGNGKYQWQTFNRYQTIWQALQTDR